MSVETSNSLDRATADLLTVKTAAEMLQVSVRTIWRMFNDGQLTPVRFRRCTRARMSEVLQILNGSARCL